MMKPSKEYRCSVSGEILPEGRVNALRELGLPESEWTSIKVAERLVRKKKGVYTGLPGISNLLVCDRVYNDNVRSVLGSVEEEE